MRKPSPLRFSFFYMQSFSGSKGGPGDAWGLSKCRVRSGAGTSPGRGEKRGGRRLEVQPPGVGMRGAAARPQAPPSSSASKRSRPSCNRQDPPDYSVARRTPQSSPEKQLLASLRVLLTLLYVPLFLVLLTPCRGSRTNKSSTARKAKSPPSPVQLQKPGQSGPQFENRPARRSFPSVAA